MPVVHATCFAAMLHHQRCHHFSHILVISKFKSLVYIFRSFHASVSVIVTDAAFRIRL
jgi:hypothetical protein